MPGTIGDPRLAVPRRRLRKLRERLMPSQRTLIVLAREHIRVTSAAALVKKIIFIILFMCSCAYSICVLLYFIAFRISIPLLISRLVNFRSSSDEKRSGFIGVVAYAVTSLNSLQLFNYSENSAINRRATPESRILRRRVLHHRWIRVTMSPAFYVRSDKLFCRIQKMGQRKDPGRKLSGILLR